MLRRVFAYGSILLVFLTITAFFAVAQEINFQPKVLRVQAEQRTGTRVVDITYDVEDQDDDMLTISVAVSDDGGSSFAVPARTFLPGSHIWRGDDGTGIRPGRGRTIIWDAGADIPNIVGSKFQVKVTASDVGMVLITAGPFMMGDAFEEGESHELPMHEVYLDDYYIDVYEVTNAQYAEFMAATGHPEPYYWNDPDNNAPDQPVVGVSWFDAAAYAQWAGKRLPTEAEWEKAARGVLVEKRYPWGDELTHDDANYVGTGGKDTWDGTSAPVGSFAPNGYGLYDVAGNVSEWCADWYGQNYYAVSPDTNPPGPDSGDDRVIRGGGWMSGPSYIRVSARSSEIPEDFSSRLIGFRCAGDVIP